MNIEIKSDKSNKSITLLVNGDITLYEAYDFKEKINNYFELKYKEIIINLSATDYIDSSGLGALISLTNSAKKKNIDFIVENPSVNIQNIIKLLKIHDALKIRTTA